MARWTQDAKDDARELLADEFSEEIVATLADRGEASSDLYNDYINGDGIFHERITDRDYSPKDAVDLLEELSAYEETDEGLWDGLPWDRVLAAKAAYTYTNAVMEECIRLISEINCTINVDEIRQSVVDALVAEEQEKRGPNGEKVDADALEDEKGEEIDQITLDVIRDRVAETLEAG